jgi:protein gp37
VSLLNQCQAFNVPFHFKQWGQWVPAQLVQKAIRPRLFELHHERPVEMVRLSKKLAGRTLEGTTWDGVPHTPHIHA